METSQLLFQYIPRCQHGLDVLVARATLKFVPMVADSDPTAIITVLDISVERSHPMPSAIPKV